MAKKRESTKLTRHETAACFYGDGPWHIRGVKRLKLPSVRLSDGPFGLRIGIGDESPKDDASNLAPTTCYPSPALLACSFDESLLYSLGVQLGSECRSHKVDVILSPGCNIKRNPLCGRNFEYYSEDPLVSGKMAASFIRGVQSTGVGACVKHFACNSQETYRMVNDSIVDERALHEIYLKPFEIVVKESDPWLLMASYNKINGVYSCDNKELLDGLLHQKWGYQGVVVSDWGASNDYINNHNNGMDIEMPGNVDRKKDLYHAITRKIIEGEAWRASSLRIQKLLEKNKEAKKVPCSSFSLEQSRETCRQAAEKSIVLLKNDGVLPLRNFKKTCIIGALANEMLITGGGSSHVNPAHVVSFLDAVRERNPDVLYSPGYSLEAEATDSDMTIDAMDIASKSDNIILFLGNPPGVESEGYDRNDLQLPDNQVRLFSELAAFGKDIIVILNVGAPVELPFRKLAKAIVLAYMPGQEGGEAIARILLNEVCPSGRLAESWPVHLLDVPSFGFYPGAQPQSLYRESVYVGYRYYTTVKKEVAYPFGYGLTYARISYDNFAISKSNLSKGESIGVSVDVVNRSKFACDHLVQIYINPDKNNVFKPDRSLIAFKKIHLNPSSTQKVEFTVSFADLAHYDKSSKSYKVEGGDYLVELASSAVDVISSKKIKVASEDEFPSLRYSLPVYYNPGSDGFLRYDNDFEALLGRPVPLARDSRQRPYTLNSTVSDIKDTYVGKKIIKMANDRLDFTGPEGKLLQRGLMELPLRSMVMQGIRQRYIAAIVHFANNQKTKAILTFLFGPGIKKRK
ncbi:MAG: glycoside hydrolase family 3 C-terminal domain-containing protein [Bacilli bacterium]|nr:glycoside hydrolase family 3 C-terminal domain-containing protein [Bacilli bacterium]